MEAHIVHVIELLALLFGGTVAILRFWPNLRQVAIFFQIALFLTQIFGLYFKYNPEKRNQLKRFVSEMMNYYLKTHPEGQHIAKNSDVDEKIEKFMNTPTQKPDRYQEVYRLLGIKVDNP